MYYKDAAPTALKHGASSKDVGNDKDFSPQRGWLAEGDLGFSNACLRARAFLRDKSRAPFRNGRRLQADSIDQRQVSL